MPVEIGFCKVCFELDCECTQDELDAAEGFEWGQDDFALFERTSSPPSESRLAHISGRSEAFRTAYFEGWVEN